MVQARKQPHTKANIYPFRYIKKIKILKTPIWLRKNNLLYKNININHTLIDDQDNKFILINIRSCILQCDANFDKREGYTINLEIDNYKNKFNYTINDASLNDSCLLNSCLYIDADDI